MAAAAAGSAEGAPSPAAAAASNPETPRTPRFPTRGTPGEARRDEDEDSSVDEARYVSGERGIVRAPSRVLSEADFETMSRPRLIQQISLSRCDSNVSDTEQRQSGMLVKAFIMSLVLVVFPCMCRLGRMSSAGRCATVIAAMLFINLWEVMQLYCTALLIPVLGTLYGVLGEGRSITETSTLLVSKIFNSTSFMVLGALVINGIFTKCGLDRRFMALLLRNFLVNGGPFLLMMMLGGTLMCSVLYSGSLVLLVALQPVLRDGLRTGVISPYDVKRILLGVAFCSNAGSALLPISSPVNLITVSLLDDFDYKISLEAWSTIALPVMMLIMLITWAALMLIYRSSTTGISQEEAWTKQLAMLPTDHVMLTDWHWTFLGVGLAAVLGITVYATKLEPIIGHSACLSLGVVVVVFGSGFMTKDEFNNLDWDILALVGGTNVMAFLVRETGLGMELSSALVGMEFVDDTPYVWLLAFALSVTVFLSALLGHSISGVIWMPLIVAIGIKLRAAEETAILIAIAIPCGMHFAHSSFDNVLSQSASRNVGRKSAELRARDFRMAGAVPSVAAVLVISTLGRTIASYFYIPPTVESRKWVPTELVPQVTKENDPGLKDGSFVLWNSSRTSSGVSSTSSWKAWLGDGVSWATRSQRRRPLRADIVKTRRDKNLRTHLAAG